jgi:hypothetical protein
MNDFLGNIIKMIKYIIIPKKDHVITLILQSSPTVLIIRDLIQMTAAIDFNDQPHFGTKEIGNVRANWMLPTEFIVTQIAVSERLP